MAPNVVIRNAALSAEVSPLGAELRSLTTETGAQLLWQGDEAHWPQRAPLLFPVIGLPRDGKVWFEGHPYPIERHGFAHGLTFDVVAQSESSVRLQAMDDADTRRSFPYAFRLVVDYSLDEANLAIAVSVHNREPSRSMPFCFGFHPGFVWPLPGNVAKGGHTLNVTSTATMKERRILSGTMAQASTLLGKDLHLELEEACFLPSAMIIEDAKPRLISYGGPAGPAISIKTSDTLPHLGVWSRGQGEYVCIEPWSALPQSENYFGDLGDRPDATNLAAGTEAAFSMTVSVALVS